VGGKDIEGTPEDNFTNQQKQALRELITLIRNSHPNIEVLGRREVKRQRTSGPALDLDLFR
jgi:N-acetyl-anhydromuramyl-L-alanine amidase AmpD